MNLILVDTLYKLNVCFVPLDCVSVVKSFDLYMLEIEGSILVKIYSNRFVSSDLLLIDQYLNSP